MTSVHITSVSYPFAAESAALAGIDLVRRAEALGLTGSAGGDRSLDLELLREIAREASALGVGSAAAQALLAADVERSPRLGDLEQLVIRLRDALREAAVPGREIPGLEGVLGADLVGAMLGISPASLRRYATGLRPVPDPVAERAHWLSLVVSDLLGAYNDFGVRRWFGRARSQLDGRAPAELLASGWAPDDAHVQQVAALAAALVGGGAAT